MKSQTADPVDLLHLIQGAKKKRKWLLQTIKTQLRIKQISVDMSQDALENTPNFSHRNAGGSY